MNDYTFFTNRQGAIGASQIAGLVYYYSDKLLAKNIISQETYDEIKKMEEVTINAWKQEVSDIKYIESPWSIKEKTKLTAEELQLLSKKTSNNNTKRGNELERPVFDKLLQNLEGFQEVENYCKQANKQYQNFRAIATIDFLIYNGETQYIIEIKTQNTTLDELGNPVINNINWIKYKLQVAMQMFLHNINFGAIVVQQVVSRDAEYDMSADLDIEIMNPENVQELIKAVENTLDYFDADFNNDFKIDHIEKKNNFLNNLKKTDLDENVKQEHEAIKNEFLTFCQIEIVKKKNDLEEKFKKDQEAIQKELKEFRNLDLQNENSVKRLENNVNSFFEKIALKRDVELLEFLARKELIMDLPSELKDDIAGMSQLENAYNTYCELKDIVEKRLKTIES